MSPAIPALLDLMRIPYTGSQPDGLLLCKDKALAKQVALSPSRPRAAFCRVAPEVPFAPIASSSATPRVVKPIAEESSDGIAKASFVRDEKEAIERLRFLHQKFNSDAMVEQYIEGRELYVSVLGNRRRVVFPPREIFFEHVPDDEPKFATSHAKWNDAYRKKWGITNGPAAELPGSGTEGSAQGRPQPL